jgi:hypothetical protein
MTYADVIIKSSNIFTALTHETIEGAVIVRGNEIVAVVANDETAEFLGPNTKVYECGERLVCPGFNDAHTHFLQNGIMKDDSFTLSLDGLVDKDETLARIKEFADAHPENKWIVGCEFNYDKWEDKPDRHMLDEIIPDRPAYFASWDMHVGWYNTKAIEAVGYKKDTVDPDGGYILREEDGTPSGLGYEAPANDPVWGLGNLACNMDSALGNCIKEALSYGVTATGLVWPYGGVPEDEHMRIFKEFEDEGKLPVRVTVFPKMQLGLENAKHWRDELKSEHLRFGGVKQITDGVCEAHTGYLTEPYADDPSTCGEPTIKHDDLYAMVEQADAEGMSVRLHCIGNGAVKQALDVFEEVQRKHGFKGLHNTIEHIESCRPEDIERFAKLGVMPSMQPIHAVLNVDGYPELLGEKWRPYMWPTKSLMEAGAIVAFGTDAPVWSLNPMEGLFAAIMRQQPWDSYPEGGFVPEQRITLGQALQAYTYGSARAENFEERLGTLAPGKLADLVVMDRNLFDATPAEILEAKPLYTFVDGKVAYQAEGASLEA